MTRKRLPFYQSLNGRFLLVLIAIGVLPIALIGISLIRTQQQSLVEQSGKVLMRDAEAFSAELNWFVAELQRDTQAIASLPDIRTLNPDAQQHTLDTLKEGAYAHFGKLAIVDLNGDILFSNPPTPTGTNITHIPSFRDARDGKQSWIIAPAVSGPQLVMHMHTPILDDAGNVTAVLGSPVGLPVLSNIIASNDATRGELAFVLGEDQIVLLASEDAPIARGVNYATLLSDAGPSSLIEDGQVIYAFNGVERLAGIASVPELGWTVIVEQSLESVLQPARQARTLSTLTVLGAVVLSALIAYAAARYLTRPVRRLAEAAHALGEGATALPLPMSGTGELGVLVDAFDTMRNAVVEREQSLKQTEALLREERELLAYRVKMRTADLEAINEELESALKTKDQFVATMSHELRTPLNAILGITDALKEGVYEPIRPKQREMLIRVHESGTHLLELINNILNVAKMESGQFELELGPTNVAGICRASLDLVLPEADRKNIQVDSQIDSQIGLVEADGLRIKQIIVNLLSNAVKFTPDGGHIGLDVYADAEEDVIQFAVWDTGVGVASADFERVFKPFVQLDDRLARTHEGTGLGLALSRQLAQLHGGQITLESEAGVGSRFTLHLPWRRYETPIPHTPVPEQALVGQPNAKRQSILLVEDNEWGIATFRDYLEFKGFEVAIARNGQEALDYVAGHATPDLILMDVQMPVMDGLECTRRLRQRADTAETPIIALTGLAMQYDRELCMMAGADEYLAKPVELETLVTRIRDRISADGTLPFAA